MRFSNRAFNEMREIKIQTNFLKKIPYSVLIDAGATKVICCASLDESFPSWLKGKGKGWITAEYGMLPKSSKERIKRERKSVSGRTHEIQRLIGRSLRAVVDLEKLGERQILIDCDVIEADGGTRTASITASFVALSLLIKDLLKQGVLKQNPILENVCAISVGIVNDGIVADLDYSEDSTAQVDMNIVMTSSLKLIEVQGTAEDKPFSKTDLIKLVELAEYVVPELIDIQNKAILG